VCICPLLLLLLLEGEGEGEGEGVGVGEQAGWTAEVLWLGRRGTRAIDFSTKNAGLGTEPDSGLGRCLVRGHMAGVSWRLSRGRCCVVQDPTTHGGEAMAEQCSSACRRRSNGLLEAFRFLDNGASWPSHVAQPMAHRLLAGRGEACPFSSPAMPVRSWR
jgi:hypothetical protein